LFVKNDCFWLSWKRLVRFLTNLENRDREINFGPEITAVAKFIAKATS